MIIANPIYDVVFKYLLEDVVRKLAKAARNKLERVLHIFSPIYQSTTDKHQLDFQGDTNDPLVKKMLDRLGRAIASEEIRDLMDVEDELDRIFEREMSKKDKIIAEKEEIIAEKEEIIAEKEEIIAEKDQLLIEEKKRAEEEKKRAEEEIQKNLELHRQIEELKKQIKP